MEDIEKRVQIINYFKKFPSFAVWMIILGLPLIAVAGIGVVLIIIGIIAIVLYVRLKKPTDKEFDSWLDEDLKELAKKSLGKMNVDESEIISESVEIVGPRYWDTGGAPILFKSGKDMFLRYTPLNTTLINFTENQLLIYNCVYDFTTGNPLNESTDEYFYKDVVSVSTRKESFSLDTKNMGKIQFNEAETFILTTSGGTAVSVVLRDPAIISKMGGFKISITRAEKAILAIRKMLRDKKS